MAKILKIDELNEQYITEMGASVKQRKLAMGTAIASLEVQQDMLQRVIDHFGLKYNKTTDCYNCNGNVDLYKFYDDLSEDDKLSFANTISPNGKLSIKFGKVNGDFSLPEYYNETYELTSLEGCPESVDGDFVCFGNQLTSLKGCPKTVGGDFVCFGSQLTSLEGCPETVDGDFDCRKNKLTSLKGCPETVGGKFDCSFNRLTSLESCPKSVGGGFYCNDNKLTSLEGCPTNVGGDFDCSFNILTSLEGCPKSVGGGFSCEYNQLTSLEGSPEIVSGSFDCNDNKLTSLEGCPTNVGGDFQCGYNKIPMDDEHFYDFLPDVIGGSISADSGFDSKYALDFYERK